MKAMEIKRSNAESVLSDFRDKFGKTLDQVSKKTGISVTTLIAIEKGRVRPRATTIYKLNQYFKSLYTETC